MDRAQNGLAKVNKLVTWRNAHALATMLDHWHEEGGALSSASLEVAPSYKCVSEL